jgi:protein-arginine kinase activator protein McsA
MKTCSDCKTEKTLEHFNYDKSRDRYLSICKKCAAIRTESYRQNNKDKWRER